MKVYEVDKTWLVDYVFGKDNPFRVFEALYLKSVDYRFTRANLRGYGFRQADINYFLQLGLIKEIEVDVATCKSIDQKHRFKYDIAYETTIMQRMKKAHEALGSTPEERSESLRKQQRNKIENDPEYAAACKASGERLAALVKIRIKKDPSIKKKIKAGGEKGGETFSKRYETDAEFRGTVLERLEKIPRKGGLARARIYARRRSTLMRSVIIPNFGSPHDVTYVRLAKYLRENEQSFVERHYSRVSSLVDAVKNDLKNLREKYPKSVNIEI